MSHVSRRSFAADLERPVRLARLLATSIERLHVVAGRDYGTSAPETRALDVLLVSAKDLAQDVHSYRSVHLLHRHPSE